MTGLRQLPISYFQSLNVGVLRQSEFEPTPYIQNDRGNVN